MLNPNIKCSDLQIISGLSIIMLQSKSQVKIGLLATNMMKMIFGCSTMNSWRRINQSIQGTFPLTI